MPDECGIACGNAAVFLRECGNASVAVLSPMGEPHTATVPPHWSKPATADRWPLIVALLADPRRESRRLGRLLERWPAERHRHLIFDDVARRLWLRGNAGDVRATPAVSHPRRGWGVNDAARVLPRSNPYG